MEGYKNIKELLQEVLEKYGFSSVEIDEAVSVKGSTQAKTFTLRVAEEDSRFFIGQQGNNLLAFQHIVRMIAGKQLPDLSGEVFFIDVNDYRRKKDQTVVDLARSAAREVEKKKEPITLRPMSSYERRIVHLELAKEKNVTTTSIGEGDERRIVVQPLS